MPHSRLNLMVYDYDEFGKIADDQALGISHVKLQPACLLLIGVCSFYCNGWY